MEDLTEVSLVQSDPLEVISTIATPLLIGQVLPFHYSRPSKGRAKLFLQADGIMIGDQVVLTFAKVGMWPGDSLNLTWDLQASGPSGGA